MPEAISSLTMATTPHPTKQTPSTPTSIRLATPLDAPQIALLGAFVFATTFGYSLPPSDLDAYLASSYSVSAISASLSDPSVTTYVALSTTSSTSSTSPTTILGFAQLTRGTSEPCLSSSPKTIELQRLYVSTEAHGLGLGRLLVEKVVEKAREEGFQTMWLGVWEDNVKAQGFYGRVGFEKCGVHDFTMGECVQTDWIMKMAL